MGVGHDLMKGFGTVNQYIPSIPDAQSDGVSFAPTKVDSVFGYLFVVHKTPEAFEFRCTLQCKRKVCCVVCSEIQCLQQLYIKPWIQLFDSCPVLESGRMRGSQRIDLAIWVDCIAVVWCVAARQMGPSLPVIH